jgi:hypothetical protein
MGRHTEQLSSGGYTNSVRLFSRRLTATVPDVAVLTRQLTRLGNKKRKAGSVQKAQCNYVAARRLLYMYHVHGIKRCCDEACTSHNYSYRTGNDISLLMDDKWMPPRHF